MVENENKKRRKAVVLVFDGEISPGEKLKFMWSP
jgi:hypothetical protein